MSNLDRFGSSAGIERVERESAGAGYRRAMRFAGRSIDDVINDPISRAAVRGYYRLGRWVERECEVGELERQWNPQRL